MSYLTAKNIVTELFNENIRLYPENYQSLNDAIDTIKSNAEGYFSERTDGEVLRDDRANVHLPDYIYFGFCSFCEWLNDGNLELDDVSRLMRWADDDLSSDCDFYRDLFSNGVFHPSFELSEDDSIHFDITLKNPEDTFNAEIVSINEIELR